VRYSRASSLITVRGLGRWRFGARAIRARGNRERPAEAAREGWAEEDGTGVIAGPVRNGSF
jgi:hypothetical protein